MIGQRFLWLVFKKWENLNEVPGRSTHLVLSSFYFRVSASASGANGSVGRFERHTRFEVVEVRGQAEDQEMLALMAPYRAEVAKLSEPILVASEEMSISTPRRERPIVSLVADIMREEASRMTGEPVDVAIMNAGGVRATLAAGPVSYQTIVTILPFDNSIVIFDMTGEELWTVMQEVAGRRFTVGLSGMEIHADKEARLQRVIIGGEPLDRKRRYSFATIDYLADGGENYDVLKNLEYVSTGIFLRDAALEYVRRLAAEGRSLDPPVRPYRMFFDGQTTEVME